MYATDSFTFRDSKKLWADSALGFSYNNNPAILSFFLGAQQKNSAFRVVVPPTVLSPPFAYVPKQLHEWSACSTESYNPALPEPSLCPVPEEARVAQNRAFCCVFRGAARQGAEEAGKGGVRRQGGGLVVRGSGQQMGRM